MEAVVGLVALFLASGFVFWLAAVMVGATRLAAGSAGYLERLDWVVVGVGWSALVALGLAVSLLWLAVFGAGWPMLSVR